MSVVVQTLKSHTQIKQIFFKKEIFQMLYHTGTGVGGKVSFYGELF